MRATLTGAPFRLLVMLAAAALFGCSQRTTTSEPPRAATADTTVTFVDKVWKVSQSSGVAPGTLYVFLSDGSLVITSTNSTPALGTWKRDGAGLTMVEESIAYPVDVLSLSPEEFKIASHNPGGVLEITMVPAATGPR